MQVVLNNAFKYAVKDYFYLIDRQYPYKLVLKLVADRYRLNTTQRIVLNRGIFSGEDASRRKIQKLNSIQGEILHVDLYNVLFTIGNYLLGRVVFIANDSFIRDAGEFYGKIEQMDILEQGVDLLVEYLQNAGPRSVIFYIDDPVDSSHAVTALLHQNERLKNLSGSVRACLSPDRELIALQNGVIASSDSIIIDESPLQIFDLGGAVLLEKYAPALLDLTEINT